MSNKSNKYTYNGETDFLEWYKNNYDGKDYDEKIGFIRPDGMSDADWNAGMQLYNSYTQSLGDNAKKEAEISNTNKYYDNQKNSLLQNYSTNLNALDESKQRAQENASITLDKLKKYLPTQMKMQGLSGLGVSESSALQAYNNYMNEMGDITANYDKNKTTLDTEKTSAENNLEKYRIDDIKKINTEYDGYERTRLKEGGAAALKAYSDGVETEQGNNFAAAKTYIESYSGTDAGELEKYITDTYSGKVSDSQLENLKALGRSQVATNVKIKEDEAAKEKDLVLEYTIIPQLDEFETNGEWDEALTYLEENKDNFTNQKEYEAKKSYLNNKIEAENKKRAEQSILKGETEFIAPNDGKTYVIQNKVKAKDLGDEFKQKIKAAGFTSAKDYRIKNGTTFTIQTGVRYEQKQVGGHYVSVPVEKTVTYYNGEWYESRPQTAQPGIASSSGVYTTTTNPNLSNYLK